MILFTESVLCTVSVITAFVCSFIYLYYKYTFAYWKRLGIPYIEPQFPYGNVHRTIKGDRPFGLDLVEFYNYFKTKGHKYGRIYSFNKPSLVAVCPEFVKTIMAREFAHFVDRGLYHNEESDPLSAHLFSLTGQKWKNLRSKLTPTFTSGKLKRMFQTLVACSFELRDCLNEPIKKTEPIDIKHFLIQYTTDVIGSCAFGIECNSFKNPDAEFITTSAKIFKRNAVDKLKFIFAFTFPKLTTLLKIRLTNKDVDVFYRKLIRETVEYREQHNVTRNDFMQLLIQLKNKGYLEDDEDEENQSEKSTTKLTLNELSAQAFLFFAAGFETSSTTLTWCLFELSQNEEIQDKLREEVIGVLKQYEGQITYDALVKMHYMDCVLNESMRKYLPLFLLPRVVTKDYTLPETGSVLKKGLSVFIPVLGLHRDPEFYPDPEKFDPDRFTKENERNRPDYTFLPFGDGPRICIGQRFAQMQMKVGLCQLLMNYKFTLDSKTKLPIVFDPLSVVASAKNKIWLHAEKLIN